MAWSPRDETGTPTVDVPVGSWCHTAAMRSDPLTDSPSGRLSENPWMWIAIATLGFGGGFPLSKALLDSGVGVWQFFTPRYVIAAFVVVAFITRGRRVRNNLSPQRV